MCLLVSSCSLCKLASFDGSQSFLPGLRSKPHPQDLHPHLRKQAPQTQRNNRCGREPRKRCEKLGPRKLNPRSQKQASCRRGSSSSSSSSRAVAAVASGVFTVPVTSTLYYGGVGGIITTNRTISPKRPFVLTIPNPKLCNPKALRPHNPKPEAVQSQSSFVPTIPNPKQCNPKHPQRPSSSSPKQCNPKHPQGLRLPARSSAIPNTPKAFVQSQTLKLNKTGSPKQCNPELSSSRRPAAQSSSSPRLQPQRAYKKSHRLTEPCTWICVGLACFSLPCSCFGPSKPY